MKLLLLSLGVALIVGLVLGHAWRAQRVPKELASPAPSAPVEEFLIKPRRPKPLTPIPTPAPPTPTPEPTPTLALTTPTPTAPPEPTPVPVASVPKPTPIPTPRTRAALVDRVHRWFPDDPHMANVVVWEETLKLDNWRDYVYGGVFNASGDCGLMQINWPVHAEKFYVRGWTVEDCFVPKKNLEVARDIYDTQGPYAWTTY